MKHIIAFVILAITSTVAFANINFNQYFCDSTLRIDYVFEGVAKSDDCEVSVRALHKSPHWAGRRVNLDRLPVEGNGQLVMTDAASGDTIYMTSFSSLFQEWMVEADTVARRAYENTFQVPMPRGNAYVDIKLMNNRRKVMAQTRHFINPNDILIKQTTATALPHKYIHRGDSTLNCIDVVIMAEGYTEEEMNEFYAHAQKTVDALFRHEPFGSNRDKFNFIAVASPSCDSGVSIPRLGEWRNTAFSSHFSTFYADRYLTTSNVWDIHDALAGIPYEHIIILANTDEYGGGGIYNSYTLTTAKHQAFDVVVVHEFGHSFGALADEYFYEEGVLSDTYPLDIEPWEQNITTRVDFASKWADMMPKGVPVPTMSKDADRYAVGLYEGGGYLPRGVYRPADECRMRNNVTPAFCPVCQRALQRMIDFYISE